MRTVRLVAFALPVACVALVWVCGTAMAAVTCTTGAKVEVRWHYSANGSPGSWSRTVAASCEDGSVAIEPQAMEGDLTVAPGTALKVGYDFMLPGNASSFAPLVRNAHVIFQARCVSGAAPSAGRIAVTMADRTYSVVDEKWYPSGDQGSALVYQGSITVPDLCGDGQIRLDAGGMFTAAVERVAWEDQYGPPDPVELDPADAPSVVGPGGGADGYDPATDPDPACDAYVDFGVENWCLDPSGSSSVRAGSSADASQPEADRTPVARGRTVPPKAPVAVGATVGLVGAGLLCWRALRRKRPQ